MAQRRRVKRAKKPVFKAGDVVQTNATAKANGLRAGKYTLVSKIGFRDSWDAKHEKANYTVQVLEEEIEPIRKRSR